MPRCCDRMRLRLLHLRFPLPASRVPDCSAVGTTVRFWDRGKELDVQRTYDLSEVDHAVDVRELGSDDAPLRARGARLGRRASSRARARPSSSGGTERVPGATAGCVALL